MVLFSLPPDVWATIVDILLKDGTGGVQGFCGLREASRAARATAHAALPSLHVQNTTPERTLRLLTSCTGILKLVLADSCWTTIPVLNAIAALPHLTELSFRLAIGCDLLPLTALTNLRHLDLEAYPGKREDPGPGGDKPVPQNLAAVLTALTLLQNLTIGFSINHRCYSLEAWLRLGYGLGDCISRLQHLTTLSLCQFPEVGLGFAPSLPSLHSLHLDLACWTSTKGVQEHFLGLHWSLESCSNLRELSLKHAADWMLRKISLPATLTATTLLHHGDLDDVGEESFGDDVALPGFRHLSLSSMPEPPDLPEQMFSQLTSLDWMLESNEFNGSWARCLAEYAAPTLKSLVIQACSGGPSRLPI
mmetsp:Transcript_6195/g.17771  ORF Transcript_6195/g.17771 Transcript_6195/m.17771 type:complete len:363 (-) Transcript_6195:990-2078(-)